jgi:hypothetical protein
VEREVVLKRVIGRTKPMISTLEALPPGRSDKVHSKGGWEMAKLRIHYRLSSRPQKHIFLKLSVFLDSLFGNPGDSLGGA